MPDFGAVPLPTASAFYLGGENGASAEALRLAPQVDEVLQPVEHLRFDYGRVAVFHIILRDRAVILHILFSEVILRVALLEQGAAFVFFIM